MSERWSGSLRSQPGTKSFEAPSIRSPLKTPLSKLSKSYVTNFARLEQALRDPSILWNDLGGQGRSPTFTGKEKKVSVLGHFTLEDILNQKLSTPPLDLETFGNFCERELNSEHLSFYLLVKEFHFVKPTGANYSSFVKHLAGEFIKVGSEKQINVPHKSRKKVLKEMEKIDEKSPSYDIFDSLLSQVYSLMATDIFPRFRNAVALKAQISEARNQALWCCKRKETPDCLSFFSYPNPVDTMHARLYRFMTIVILLAGVVENFFLEPGYILFLTAAISMSLRAISGPRLDPLSFFLLFVLDPIFRKLRVLPSKFVKNKARRFSDGFGSVFLLILSALAIIDKFPARVLVWIFVFIWTVLGLIHGVGDDM